MTPGTALAPPENGTCVLDDSALQTPLALLYSLIFALGLVGNLVALWAFFCVHSKMNSVRVFLINVAFADLLLVVCLPFRILYHSRKNSWDLSPTLCVVVGNLFYMNMYVSIILLGLISVDRYVKIHHGTRARRLSGKWSSVLCAVVWLGVFATMLYLVVNICDSNMAQRKCFHFKALGEGEHWKAYINMAALAVFWLVFVCLMVSYGKIALKLRRRSRDKPDLPNAPHYSRSARKSSFVLFVFTVCFVPYHSVRVFYIATQITEVSCLWKNVADKANEMTLLLSALNSCLDPVLYFVLSSPVRKEVLRLMDRLFHVRDVAGSSGSSSTADVEYKKGSSSKK
ncbi:unnamed protein product [Menidia menidia]|uniref:Probable G-protein coupled receptor 34 n=1 Tax=Menidia menidia TaxID=238744 RepID=A0A8S4AF93_9TELE|nr:unnamed protein product [Menidia menidia]